MIENIRTFALPFESQTYTFKMEYEYDPFNRIQSILYPDSELVEYRYNLGGMLNKVKGSVTRKITDLIVVTPMQNTSLLQGGNEIQGGGIAPGIIPDPGPIEMQTVTLRYPYLDSIVYNKFELKDSVIYGNGTRVRYVYDSLQRLSALRSYTADDELMQDIAYHYDSVGNILDIENSAAALGNGLGGTYRQEYTYDNLYRLTHATGWWECRPDHLTLRDTVDMRYSKNGRIIRKRMSAETLKNMQLNLVRYDRQYQYPSVYSNKVNSVTDAMSGTSHQFEWESGGNLMRHMNPDQNYDRRLWWTEDNRLLFVKDNGSSGAYYQYDAGGDRTYKLLYHKTTGSLNGVQTDYYTLDDATLYVSPYLVVTPQGYTKHYYAETERITTQLGKYRFAVVDSCVAGDSLAHIKLQNAAQAFPTDSFPTPTPMLGYLHSLTNHPNTVSTLYFYHPDHLGSASWITNIYGKTIQHLYYLPWGEDFVNQRTGSFSSMYTFSAKEKDTETGYSYFGSRYYNSDLSIWLSVDPMSDKYPSLSPYVYCADNPIKLVDPNGEDIVPYGLLLYYGLEKGGRERSHESIKVGIYTVTPFYDNNNQLIGYNAVREYQQNGKTFWRAEYQMDPSDLQAFKDNVKYYERCANMIYASGEPDWRYVAFGYNLMQSQFGASASIFGSIWQDAFQNPGFWLSMALSTGYSALNMQANSILTNARNGRGCFELGSASYAEANMAGAKWVGENYWVSSNGRMWISADGLRQYRLPSYKPKLKKYQANFESRNTNGGKWINNGHLDVNM